MIVSFLMLTAGQQQRRLQIQSGRYDINHCAVAAELFIESMNINVKEKGGNRFFSPRDRCPYSFLLLAGDRCQQQRQIQPVHRDRGVAYDGGKHAMVVVLGRSLQKIMVPCRSVMRYSKSTRYDMVSYQVVPYSHHDVVQFTFFPGQGRFFGVTDRHSALFASCKFW